jgi:hypothetical protein
MIPPITQMMTILKKNNKDKIKVSKRRQKNLLKRRN